MDQTAFIRTASVVRVYKDMISELPDCILLYIMNFMDTKDAVRTCVLSKRWKDLCKQITNLTFSENPVTGDFKNFVSWVMSSRDNSYSLHRLSIETSTSPVDLELYDRVIKHALFHNVQDLKFEFGPYFGHSIECFPSIFCSQSLKSLQLSSCAIHPKIVVESLNLSALKILYLSNAKFYATHNNSADPFSNCRVLNTLVLGLDCSLHNDAKELCISNSTLSNLTILGPHSYDIVLSTPNLSSFTINGFISHQLSSTCNLSFLEEANIITCWWTTSVSIMRWLHVLVNTKTLRLSFFAMLDLLPPISVVPQPPRLVRLESLEVIRPLNGLNMYVDIADENVNKVAKFLLQNSLMARFEIITDASKFSDNIIDIMRNASRFFA